MIRSAKNVLVVFFLVPYLIVVGVTLAWFTGDWAYVAVYIPFTGLLSHLALQTSVLIDPELPFSKPTDRAGSSRRILLSILLIGVFSAFVPMVTRLFNRSASATTLVFATIIALSMLMDRLARARIDRQAQRLEFEG